MMRIHSILTRLLRTNAANLSALNSVDVPLERIVFVWNKSSIASMDTIANDSPHAESENWSEVQSAPIVKAIQAKIKGESCLLGKPNLALTAEITGDRKGGLVRWMSSALAKRIDSVCDQISLGKFDWQDIENEFGRIRIGVDQEGKPFLVSGLISYALATSTKLKTVPADVVTRAPQWQAFRDKLIEFARQSLDEDFRIKNDLSHYGGRLYQQAYHFDTSDIDHVYGRERFEAIHKCVDAEEGTVLDIGANFGLLCSEFEKAGFDCTAVELKSQDFYYLEKLRSYSSHAFRAEKCSIFDFRGDEKLDYDIVLALFIFHHFMKSPDLLEQLTTLLKRITCREMYLGVPDPNEAQMKSAFQNLSADDFAKFVMEHTHLTKCERIECPGLRNRAVLRLS